MKKSEMLNLIQSVLIESCDLKYLDTTYESVSELLLNKIEKAGMLPPGYERNFSNGLGNEFERISYSYHEWDNENE